MGGKGGGLQLDEQGGENVLFSYHQNVVESLSLSKLCKQTKARTEVRLDCFVKKYILFLFSKWHDIETCFVTTRVILVVRFASPSLSFSRSPSRGFHTSANQPLVGPFWKKLTIYKF